MGNLLNKLWQFSTVPLSEGCSIRLLEFETQASHLHAMDTCAGSLHSVLLSFPIYKIGLL